MRAVRVVRGKRGCLSVVAARRAPPFGSDFGRQWCLCTKTARPTRFSTRKAVQGGAEGAWGLGSECCGQALRWRRVCAPVLRRQRCACERLTSRGVRGRVGFRFGRPVFWAGAGAEALRRWPASLLQTALGSEPSPAPDERRPHHTVSSLGAVGPRAARRTRGAQYAHNAGRRASDQICASRRRGRREKTRQLLPPPRHRADPVTGTTHRWRRGERALPHHLGGSAG